ncbi:phage portal protein [Actinosynnema sp. CA-248983]
MNLNAKRFLFSEDADVKFGTLDETPLGGYIESIDMSIRHLAAVSQTPPHHLLGQIANLSAEALLAAETALSRKIEEFRRVFSEAWERVFRLAAELAGDSVSAEDFHGEVLWRDMEQRSLAQSADALGKLAEQLNVPRRGLWRRIPGVTQNEIDDWEDLREEEDAELMLAASVRRATAPTPVRLSDAEPVAA